MSIKVDSGTVIREQLLALLNGGNAHMDFEGAVSAFPDGYINRKPPHVSYTFWHLLEHMRIAQWDILEFIRKPGHLSPHWPDDFWPPEHELADRERWEKTLHSIRSDLESVREIVRSPDTDFFSPIAHAKEYSIFRELLLVADHNAYHTGELITLRQVVNIPPPDRW